MFRNFLTHIVSRRFKSAEFSGGMVCRVRVELVNGYRQLILSKPALTIPLTIKVLTNESSSV